jgi:glycosyltransferase involved in cell wall biosynthesis
VADFFFALCLFVGLSSKHKLSAVIITFNEERNIDRCLKSLHGVADEIVVVDSFSTDKTQEIVAMHNAIFIQHAFEGHIQQKNFALSQASNDLVISLDADEALSETLRNNILKVKMGQIADGYSMNRLSNYCGHWIRHGSWYPDKKLRLFNRTKVQWAGINPHDKAEAIEGSIINHLDGDILHYTYYTIEEHVKKLDYFSSIAAKAYLKKNKKAGWFDLAIRPGFAFFRDFILRAGFLDGYYGWVIARFTAHYTMQKYVKLRFLIEQNQTNKKLNS